MNYQTEKTIREVAVYTLTWGVIMLLLVGVMILTKHENVGIEARCQAAGGQVLQSPGNISKCLLPVK
jgi:hypothetical protein